MELPVACAAETLRRLGRPATRVRGEILRILAGSQIPLAPKEILARVPEPKPDLSTVYRTLAFLVSSGLARSVALHERSRRYEAALDGEHRHRAVCRRCGRIESFRPDRCDLSRMERAIGASLGFQVTDHSLEFFGTCGRCRPAEARR